MAEKRNYTKKTNQSTPIQANEYGKLPPQAPELEEAVLGAIMIEKDAYSLVSEILKPECFYKDANQKIFTAIMTLALHQEPIDMHTVTEQLRKDGTIDDIGGPYYITLMTAKVSSAAHLEYHSRIIVQKFLARELIRISSEIQTKAFDDKTDVDDLMQEAEGMLFEVSQRNLKKDVTQINTPVAVFPLEMSNVQLVNRLIMNVCQLEGEKIKNGQLDKYEWEKFDRDINMLLDAPLYVDDTPSLSIFELRSKARRLVKEHKIQCLIIDYLQLMNASGMSFGSREQEVSIISRSLKGLAKELDIPIIALSQLNRGVEGRTGIEGKRPQLSDLRESGAIEQDADMVCFIHRPEYYKIMEDLQGNSLAGIAEIIIAKHRNGATADVQLKFKNTYAKFLNKDDVMEDDNPFDSGGYQVISSKMNDTETSFYGEGQKTIPPKSSFPGGRNDETPF